MTLNEYMEAAIAYKTEETDNPLYMLFELAEEVGELHGKFAKALRAKKIYFEENDLVFSQNMSESEREDFLRLTKKEVGDILWGIAGICSVMGWTMEDVGVGNIDKISDRFRRGVIVGEGDER
jgi:NTP pyrophosphatase (non-canonical NTP hydrolase)